MWGEHDSPGVGCGWVGVEALQDWLRPSKPLLKDLDYVRAYGVHAHAR